MHNRGLRIMKMLDQILGQVKDIFARSLVSNAVPTGSLGVDIGSCAVKVVRLEGSKEGLKLLGYGVEKIVDKNVRDALSKALVKAKATPEQTAVLSVAGQGVVSRYVELPLMSKSELESSMKFEIEKYVPFPLAEVSADYAVVHEMREKAKMFVLIAAAKNDLVQKKCNLAQEVNLNLKAMDLDCLALANFAAEVAQLRDKGACYGVINMGKTVSNINILVGGVPYLSRDIFIGGDDLTKKMAEVLEIEYAEAEKLKNTPGDKKEELLSVWDPVLNNLAAEIRVSLDYFESRNNRAVDKIYLTGGLSRLEGVDVYLNRLLAVDIKKLDYTDKLTCDDSVNMREFKRDSDLLAIAFGLALR
jgi:type IV pilus assembly protein PilM